MKDKIKNIYSQNKTLISNFSFLSALQVFQLLLPLITYPYLIRVVGKEMYGTVIFAQAVISYFIITIDYGFSISATKEISVNRENKDKINEISSAVFSIKFIITIIAMLIMFGLFIFVPEIEKNKLLYSITFISCFGQLLFPIWFFQGIEKMKYITYVNIISRTIFAVSIFFIIKKESDYLWIPALSGIGILLGSIISLYFVFIKYKVKFIFLPLKIIYKYFKESTPFFFSRASSVVITQTNIILIGAFLGKTDVAYYDLARKVVNILITPFSIISRALYPNVAKTQNMRLVKKVIKITIVSSLLIYLALIIGSDTITLLLGGEKLMPAANLFYTMGLSIPLIGTTYLLGSCVLVVKGYSKEFNLSTIYSMFLYIILAIILGATGLVTVQIIILLKVLIDIFIVIYRYWHIHKHKLLTS